MEKSYFNRKIYGQSQVPIYNSGTGIRSQARIMFLTENMIFIKVEM
jgi:hypothetical protein